MRATPARTRFFLLVLAVLAVLAAASPAIASLPRPSGHLAELGLLGPPAAPLAGLARDLFEPTSSLALAASSPPVTLALRLPERWTAPLALFDPVAEVPDLFASEAPTDVGAAPSLLGSRVGAFEVFGLPSPPCPAVVSDRNATGFRFGLVENCGGRVQTNIYAFVGWRPNLATDPTGEKCRGVFGDAQTQCTDYLPEIEEGRFRRQRTALIEQINDPSLSREQRNRAAWQANAQILPWLAEEAGTFLYNTFAYGFAAEHDAADAVERRYRELAGASPAEDFFTIYYQLEAEGYDTSYLMKGSAPGAPPSKRLLASVDEAVRAGRLRVVSGMSAPIAKSTYHEHHLFTRARAKWFRERYGIDVDDFVVDVDVTTHEALHAGKKALGQKAGWWDAELMTRLRRAEARKGTDLTRDEVIEIGDDMRSRFSLEGAEVHRYTRAQGGG